MTSHTYALTHVGELCTVRKGLHGTGSDVSAGGRFAVCSPSLPAQSNSINEQQEAEEDDGAAPETQETKVRTRECPALRVNERECGRVHCFHLRNSDGTFAGIPE